MAICFHSNGPSLISVCGSQLGYATADGVEIDIDEELTRIFSDQWGPFVPAAVVRNGSLAFVRFDLIQYDNAVLLSYMAQREGGVLGQEGNIGELIYNTCTGQNRTCALSIASPNDGQVYNFPITIIDGPASKQVSTQPSVWSLVIACFPNPSTGVLYTITAS